MKAWGCFLTFFPFANIYIFFEWLCVTISMWSLCNHIDLLQNNLSPIWPFITNCNDAPIAVALESIQLLLVVLSFFLPSFPALPYRLPQRTSSLHNISKIWYFEPGNLCSVRTQVWFVLWSIYLLSWLPMAFLRVFSKRINSKVSILCLFYFFKVQLSLQ